MRVVSSLADIEFGIGRISRVGGDLVIASDDDSTIATKVTVTPRDALRSLGVLATSPSAWRFLLTLPLAAFRRDRPASAGTAWEERRRGTGINKPW